LPSKEQQHSESKGRIAVIGERELVIGYRLLGVDDTFIVNGGDESFKTMENLFFSHKYSMIIASQFIRDYLPSIFRKKVEASIEPLVLFMPMLKGDIQEESISSLARRVLGINIKY
jgi:V/A-type H+/Na+-transporting ATPase subunit F